MVILTQMLEIIRYTFNQQNKLLPAEKRYCSLNSARMLSFTLSTTTKSLWEVGKIDGSTEKYSFLHFFKQTLHCIYLHFT